MESCHVLDDCLCHKENGVTEPIQTTSFWCPGWRNNTVSVYSKIPSEVPWSVCSIGNQDTSLQLKKVEQCTSWGYTIWHFCLTMWFCSQVLDPKRSRIRCMAISGFVVWSPNQTKLRTFYLWYVLRDNLWQLQCCVSPKLVEMLTLTHSFSSKLCMEKINL